MAHADSNRSALEIVRKLNEHWPELTREDFHTLLAPDCVFLNVPMPDLKCVGPDQIFQFLSAFARPWVVELSLTLIRGDASAVLVERVEKFRKKSGEGPVIELRSMGAFELRDGKVTHWRDYFDPRETMALVQVR